MSTKIRMARGGAKNRPFYRIVVANSRSPRDGKFIEKIGTYNPLLEKSHSDRIVLNKERVSYWLSCGATPSEKVTGFIQAMGIQLPEHLQRAYELRLKARKPKAPKKKEE